MNEVSISEKLKSQLIFRGYHVYDIDFKLNHQFNYTNPVDVQFILGAEVKLLDDITKTAVVTVRCKVFEKPEENNYPFSLRVNISGDFIFDGNIEEEGFLQFCQTSGIATLLPYLRSIVTSITGIANVEPLVLPLLNVKNLQEKLKEEKTG